MSQAGILNRNTFPPFSVTETLTGNTGGPVGPDGANNINVVGDGTTIDIVGNPGTFTLTVSAGDIIATQYTTDAGVAVPAAGNLNVFGGTAARDINTSGAGDTIHVDLNNSITLGDLAVIPGATDAITLVSGDASLDLGNINFFVNANPTGGCVTYNGTRFMHNAGANSAYLGDSSGNFTGANGCVGIGTNALFHINAGNFNSAVGFISMEAATSATNNCALGAASLQNLVSGQENIAIGFSAGTAYNAAEEFNICIGNVGIAGEDDTIRIGTPGDQAQCFIAGVDGVDLGAVVTVVTEDNNQLGTANITGAGGIVINASSNQIEIDGSGISGAGTITGNDGTPEAQVANNWDILTANSTVLFNANGAGETLDFNPANLMLGSAGASITTGVRNVTAGNLAGDALVDGTDNTFIGDLAGRSAIDSAFNVAIGSQALLNLGASASNNIAIGYQALSIAPDTIANNIAIGSFSLNQLGSGAASNIAIGVGAGINYVATESNNICIENAGVVNDNSAIRIGNNGNQTTCYVAGIANVAMDNASAVVFADQSTDKLGTFGNGGNVTLSSGANDFIANGGLTVDAVGQMTNPAQPCFFATLTATSNNVTGAGTDYVVVYDTVIKDQGSNFDGVSTFTAPVTGTYLFIFACYMSGTDVSMISGFSQLRTSGGVFQFEAYNPYLQGFTANNWFIRTYSAIVPLSIGGTATTAIRVFFGASDSIDLLGTADTGGFATSFSGYLIC